MAIFNKYYPKDIYENGVPQDVKEAVPALYLVCAVGQKFVNKFGNSLNVKSSGYYYDIPDPRYPGGGEGKLCADIASERAVWVTGTAFAISQNTFITARHVVDDIMSEAGTTDPTKLLLVGGFYLKNSNSSPFTYNFLEVTKIQYHPDMDICQITTKSRSAKYLNLAPTSEQRSLRADNPIHMMGFPLGQALKYSEGQVAEVSGDLDRFSGFISFFPGNSGSPVFNSKTGNVVGVLVAGSSGIIDWQSQNNCIGYKSYANGEDMDAKFYYAENFNM
ncbi:S1 family peptidase [Ekhidna sp. To15]|uniref:S1 family peptidase n=1 Tax=Ekhidna sp. To15 TaxID=3395267 RepID=UPI003F51D488